MANELVEQNNPGPKYQHDCDDCNFSGALEFHNMHVDIYRCGHSFYSGFLFRFSDEPSDNTHMPEQVVVRLASETGHPAEEVVAALSQFDFGTRRA